MDPTGHQIDEDDKLPPSHGIYWSDSQNDDILLQNLFANTLLSDEFSVKKTDFDLSFDNLQLNLDHDESTSAPTTTSTGASTSQTDKTGILMLNEAQSTGSMLELQATSEPAVTSVDVTSDLEKQILADTLSMTLNLNQQPTVVKEPTTTTETDEFKKSEFITLTNLNLFDSNDFVINLNTNLDSSTTAKKSIALLQSKLKESASSANSKLKKIRKRSKLVNSGSTGSNVAVAAATSQDTAVNTAKKELKLVKLKQSRLTSNSGTSSTGSTTINKSEKHHKVARMSKLDGNKTSKSGVEPLTKKFAASNSQISLTSPTSVASSNNSSFGFSSSATNDLNNDKNIIILKSLKKDEVDLHIKELSLLDLHSSEDDSDLNNKNRGKIRANMSRVAPTRPSYRASSNNQTAVGVAATASTTILSNSSSFLSSSSSSTSSLATNLINSVSNCIETSSSSLLGNNELISKRVKYSPASSQSMITTGGGHLVNVPETVEDPACKYLSKSLDSEAVAVAASTSGMSQSNNSGILSPLSPPSMACKKKRKKKDNGVDAASKQTESDDQKPTNQSITLVNLTQYPVQNQYQFQTNQIEENDTLQHMKNLDLNNDLIGGGESNKLSSNLTVNLDLNDINSRNYLWNLLKAHSTHDELIYQFGSVLHDKITFWDLAQLKLKYAKSNQLKTTYQIIDDYTVLYSNMRTYMEKVVNEQSSSSSSSLSLIPAVNSSRKSDNSSRSRSSSRNPRKQSTSSVNR